MTSQDPPNKPPGGPDWLDDDSTGVGQRIASGPASTRQPVRGDPGAVFLLTDRPLPVLTDETIEAARSSFPPPVAPVDPAPRLPEAKPPIRVRVQVTGTSRAAAKPPLMRAPSEPPVPFLSTPRASQLSTGTLQGMPSAPARLPTGTIQGQPRVRPEEIGPVAFPLQAKKSLPPSGALEDRPKFPPVPPLRTVELDPPVENRWGNALLILFGGALVAVLAAALFWVVITIVKPPAPAAPASPPTSSR